jgi:hypothetical protein
VKIALKETKQILNDIMIHNQTPPDAKTEILTWYDIVTSQNYFTNGTNINIKKDGLAMGAPSSGILSEMFLQKLENTKLIDIANELQLITYHRYVDDILIVYDIRHTDINTITTKFNDMHPNLHFTHETEQTNTINYLDVTINRRNNHVDIAIYRKPTYTDAIIPYTSNHPPAHKYAAIRYMYNRLESYQLNNIHYSQEINTIQNILYNNQFPLQTHIRPQRKQHQNTTTTEPQSQNKKWVKFTYIGKETNIITKIFKNTNLRIAYHTANTILKQLAPHDTTTDIYNSSGIHKLTCQNCKKAYVGQTGRSFHARFLEHKRAFKNNTAQSKFAQHASDHGHMFGTIQNTMEILHIQKKGTHLNTLERYCIHKEAKINNHLNEDQVDITNPIFDILSRLTENA